MIVPRQWNQDERVIIKEEFKDNDKIMKVREEYESDKDDVSIVKEVKKEKDWKDKKDKKKKPKSWYSESISLFAAED